MKYQEQKVVKLNNREDEALILNDEVKTKKNKDDIPSDTEKIILEAEKFLKK